MPAMVSGLELKGKQNDRLGLATMPMGKQNDFVGESLGYAEAEEQRGEVPLPPTGPPGFLAASPLLAAALFGDRGGGQSHTEAEALGAESPLRRQRRLHVVPPIGQIQASSPQPTDRPIAWEHEAAKEMADMRQLVEIAAQRVSELQEAVALAQAGGFVYPSSGGSSALASVSDVMPDQTHAQPLHQAGDRENTSLRNMVTVQPLLVGSTGNSRCASGRSSCRNQAGNAGCSVGLAAASSVPQLRVLSGGCIASGSPTSATQGTRRVAVAPALARRPAASNVGSPIQQNSPGRARGPEFSPSQRPGRPSAPSLAIARMNSPTRPNKSVMIGASSPNSHASIATTSSPQPAHAGCPSSPALLVSRMISSPADPPRPGSPVHVPRLVVSEVVRRHSCPHDALRPNSPSPTSSNGVLRMQSAVDNQEVSNASAQESMLISSDRAVSQAGMGWNSLVKSMVELSQAGHTCARGRVYLYQAPFTPSIRYKQGVEHFILPPGWAVLRSRQGLLVWLELLDDLALREVTQSLAATSVPEGASTQGSERSAGPLVLQLPGVTSGVLGQIEIRRPRSCVADAPIRVPCEDIVVLRPNGDGCGGLRGQLVASSVCASGGGVNGSFDSALKAWLGSWETQI